MKKTVILLVALALILSSAPVVFAHGGSNKNRYMGEEEWTEIKADIPASFPFVINGTVKAKSSDSMTLEVRGQGHGPQWFKHGFFRRALADFMASDSATVKVNADTKYSAEGKTITLNDIVVDSKVMVSGKADSTANTLTASSVKLIIKNKQKVFGEVTAKTDTSVTVKNNVTGETKTVTVNPETKIIINGETKAATDVHVGDKGVVKFKDVLGTLVAKIVNLFR